jgi:hypothetical protein
MHVHTHNNNNAPLSMKCDHQQIEKSSILLMEHKIKYLCDVGLLQKQKQEIKM